MSSLDQLKRKWLNRLRTERDFTGLFEDIEEHLELDSNSHSVYVLLSASYTNYKDLIATNRIEQQAANVERANIVFRLDNLIRGIREDEIVEVEPPLPPPPLPTPTPNEEEDKPGKRIVNPPSVSWWIKVLLSILILLIIGFFGIPPLVAYLCIDENEAYDKLEPETIPKLERFLKCYPNCEHHTEVEQRLKELKAYTNLQPETIPKLEQFLKDYPKSKHYPEVKQRLEDLEVRVNDKLHTARGLINDEGFDGKVDSAIKSALILDPENKEAKELQNKINQKKTK